MNYSKIDQRVTSQTSSDQPLFNSSIYNKSSPGSSGQLTSTDKDIQKIQDRNQPFELLKSEKQNSADLPYQNDHKSSIFRPFFKPNYIPTNQDLLKLEESIKRSQSGISTADSRYPTLRLSAIPEKSSNEHCKTLNHPQNQQNVFKHYSSMNKNINNEANQGILQQQLQIPLFNQQVFKEN